MNVSTPGGFVNKTKTFATFIFSQVGVRAIECQALPGPEASLLSIVFLFDSPPGAC